MKRSEIRTLKTEFSLMVRHRMNGCEAVGQGRRKCSDLLQCSHIFAVGSHPNLQFHPWNATAMCFSHHFSWWDKVPSESGLWIRAHLGEWYEKLSAIQYTFTTKHMSLAEVRQLWKHTKGWWA